jgi:hypothetical protein
MPHKMRIACVVVLGLTVLPPIADAQRFYPGGYGRYGWGGWGMGGGVTDPVAGYMAGLGSFARGQGVYEVEHAKAQAINFETMQKWNQALRARQQQLQREKQKEEAQQQARCDARVARMELDGGTTLNNLLMRIYDFDPNAGKSARSKAPIGGAAVRDIPFSWNTEAITICIDQMTGKDALPEALTDSGFTAERAALGKEVEAALKEDAQGDVSPQTMKRVTTAIADFRAKFLKEAENFSTFVQ